MEEFMSDLNEWRNEYLSRSRPGEQQIPLDKVSHKKLLTPKQTSEVIDRSVNTLSTWRAVRRRWKKLPATERALFQQQKGPRYIRVKKSGRMRIAYRMSDLISWVEIRHIHTIRKGFDQIDRVLKRQVAALDALRVRQINSCDEVFVRLQDITPTLVPPTDARYPDQIEWDILDFEEYT
tara:strand:- start:79 stop:615 length:537 start_codon:yes stop_codon:yes gene_type:complete